MLRSQVSVRSSGVSGMWSFPPLNELKTDHSLHSLFIPLFTLIIVNTFLPDSMSGRPVFSWCCKQVEDVHMSYYYRRSNKQTSRCEPEKLWAFTG